jgi:hypothetical protein
VATHRDVVVALLEASASLSGLLLVFLGFVVSIYTGLSRGTADKARASLERAAIGLLVSFLIGLSCVALATAWLVDQERDAALYATTIGFFGAQLVGLGVATALAMKAMLRVHHRSATTPGSSS